MQEPTGSNKEGEYYPGAELEQISRQILDAPGYVLFVGVLTNKLNDRGRNIIEFQYRRQNYTHEDALLAVKQFDAAIRQDMKENT